MIAFIAAVGVAPWLPFLASPHWQGGLLLMLGVTLVGKYLKQQAPGEAATPSLTAAGAVRPMLLGALLGSLWAGHFASNGLAHRLPEQLSGMDWLVEGVVVGLPENKGRLYRFEMLVERARLRDGQNGGADYGPRRLRLSWYNAEAMPRPGQRWHLQVRLKTPHGFANPGSFDYERWLFSRGVDATGYVRRSPGNQQLQQHWFSGRGRLDALRLHLSDQLMATAPGGAGATFAALTVGDKRHIGEQDWEVLRQTGTLHLMVISGLHIGLIALLGLRVGRWGGRWLLAYTSWSRPSLLAALLAIGMAASYAALAGFTLPTQRALIMVVGLLLADLVGRCQTWRDRWLLAMGLVVALDPLAFWAPGFWLSFMAVASLLLWSQSGATGAGFFNRIRQAISAQWAVALGLLPLLIFFFQQLSWVAPLTNLFAIPVIGLLVVPGSLLATLGLQLEVPGADLLLVVVAEVLRWVWLGLEAAAALPAVPASWMPPLWALIPAVLLLYLCLLAARLFLYPALVSLVPLFVASDQRLHDGEYRLRMLDVGQGTAVVVETRNHRLLYDTGGRWGGNGSAAKSSIIPFFRAQGIRSLDTVVISHADQDHAGGLPDLLGSIDIDLLISPSPKILQRYEQAMSCLSDVSWHWDGVRFRILHPYQAGVGDENDRSCVIQIDNGFPGVVLTGDIPASVEMQLVGRFGGQLQAVAVLASHHGSADASSDLFLQATGARYLLVSAGFQNRYGHPAKAVVSRIADQDGQLWNTAEQGMVTLTVDANGKSEVRGYRAGRWAYW